MRKSIADHYAALRAELEPLREWLVIRYYVWRFNWFPPPVRPDIQLEVDETLRWIRFVIGVLIAEDYPSVERIEGTQSGRIRSWRKETFWQHRVICGGWQIGTYDRDNLDYVDSTPVYLLSDGSIAYGVNGLSRDSVSVFRLKKWRRLPGVRASWNDSPLLFGEICYMLRYFIGETASSPYWSRVALDGLADSYS